MTAQLPEGYHARALTPEYEAGAVEAINAAYRWMNGGILTYLEEMQVEWHGGDTPAETNTQIVIAPDGSVAGYIDEWDLNALRVRKYSLGYVHPDHIGRGIGTYLLQWSIERGLQDVSLAPDGSRVVLHQNTNTNNLAACQLFEQNGFRLVRYSYRMRIDLDTPVRPVVPEGIAIRPFHPGEERAVFRVAYDSFKDHWGAADEPFEEFARRWAYHLENDPTYDPALWLVAAAGEDLVGVSLCYPYIEEDPGMGWVGTLGVLRDWRKRGLGMALLQSSFAAFQERGLPRAGLGVDADSMTGAVHLYENAGMRVWRKNCTYEYELRAGEDLLKK